MKHLTKIQTEFLHKKNIRTLGKTKLIVFPFGLGGQALLESPNKENDALSLINLAMEHGINYFDTAVAYGPSRYYLGLAFNKTNRNEVIIASKTDKRDYLGAKHDLDESLELLRTDYIDILQLHAIEKEQDLVALMKNGAIKLLLEVKVFDPAFV